MTQKNTRAVSVGSRARLNKAQNWSRTMLYLELNKPNKQNVFDINLITISTFLSLKITVDTLIDVKNETSKRITS